MSCMVGLAQWAWLAKGFRRAQPGKRRILAGTGRMPSLRGLATTSQSRYPPAAAAADAGEDDIHALAAARQRQQQRLVVAPDAVETVIADPVQRPARGDDGREARESVGPQFGLCQRIELMPGQLLPDPPGVLAALQADAEPRSLQDVEQEQVAEDESHPERIDIRARRHRPPAALLLPVIIKAAEVAVGNLLRQ